MIVTGVVGQVGVVGVMVAAVSGDAMGLPFG